MLVAGWHAICRYMRVSKLQELSVSNVHRKPIATWSHLTAPPDPHQPKLESKSISLIDALQAINEAVPNTGPHVVDD